ncbi:protein of unknown function [Microbacterium sp. Nx66]|nr:protein of unknown function [Microbacterium sp. Nx66]
MARAAARPADQDRPPAAALHRVAGARLPDALSAAPQTLKAPSHRSARGPSLLSGTSRDQRPWAPRVP